MIIDYIEVQSEVVDYILCLKSPDNEAHWHRVVWRRGASPKERSSNVYEDNQKLWSLDADVARDVLRKASMRGWLTYIGQEQSIASYLVIDSNCGEIKSAEDPTNFSCLDTLPFNRHSLDYLFVQSSNEPGWTKALLLSKQEKRVTFLTLEMPYQNAAIQYECKNFRVYSKMSDCDLHTFQMQLEFLKLL